MGACFVFVIWVKFHVKHFIIELMVKKASKVLTMLESSGNSLKNQNNRQESTIIICGLLRHINIICNDENVHVKHEYYQINQKSSSWSDN